MHAQVNCLVAVLLIHGVCASYSGHYANEDSYSYGDKSGYAGDYGYNHGYNDLKYHGPTAIPHVLHDGHIADTHEVAAAKAAHYAAVAKAKAHSGYGHGGSYAYEGDYGYGNGHSSYGGYGQDYAGAYHTTPYYGPLAKPVVLKSGYLADTHEVAAAKAAHHTAVAVAKAHSGYGGDYGYEGSYGYGHGYGYGDSYEGYGQNYHSAPYHGPLAKPVVLKSGYLADTHEVAAAKDYHLHALRSATSHYGYDHK